MVVQYLIGGILGVLGGCVAIFFTEEGWQHLFPLKELLHTPGNGMKLRLILTIAGLLIGLYDVWLYRAINLNYIGHFLLCVGLLSAAPSDIRSHAISSTLLITFSVIGILYNFCWLDVSTLINSAFGAFIGFAVLGIPYLLRKGSVGMGDLLLLAICGLYTGFPEVIYLLVRTLLFMATWGIIRLIQRKAEASSEVPVAPFLLLATLI